MEIELDEKQRWSNIREKLNQFYKYDDSWEEAINIFSMRLENKFFKPLQSLIDKRTHKGEGFTIVAVQCALIEMLSAFRKGKIFNHFKNKTSPKYEYNQSRKVFMDLLLTGHIFENHFWQFDSTGKKIDGPYNSIDFYSDVRCGLMHEARTKGKWHITTAPISIDPKVEKKFIGTENGKIKIYRTILHYRLIDYKENYKNELRQKNADGELLRKHFARKMDNLFDFTPDTAFDWWIA